MKHLRLKLSLILLFTALLATTTTAKAADTLVVPGNNLDVFVDIDTCAQGFTWCSGSGSVGPAAAGNDSVVGVVIHVKRNNGTPVSGAPENFFALSSITNPAPGVTPVFVDSVTCPACFSEPETGVYRLAARPSSGNWGEGTYMVLLEFGPAGTPFFQTVVPFDIPM